MDIKKIIAEEYHEDMQTMSRWCDELYEQKFASHFSKMRELYSKLKLESGTTITDPELEWAITSFPLELFTVSESLNAVRLDYEMVKLKNKDKRSKVSDRGDLLENDIILAAYASVITRVENEISFSREFIMGAKKVWDSRRRVEKPPIDEVVPRTQVDLPDYYPTKQTYIQ